MALTTHEIQIKLAEIKGFSDMQSEVQAQFIHELVQIQRQINEAEQRLHESKEAMKSWSWEYAKSWIPGTQSRGHTIIEELLELNAIKQSILGEILIATTQHNQMQERINETPEDDARARAVMILGSIPGFFRLPRTAGIGESSQQLLIDDYIEKEKQAIAQSQVSDYILAKELGRIYNQYVVLIAQSTQDNFSKFDPQILRGRHYFARKKVEQRIAEKIEKVIDEKLTEWQHQFYFWQSPSTQAIEEKRNALKNEINEETLRDHVSQIKKEEWTAFAEQYFYGDANTTPVSEVFFDLTKEQQQQIMTQFIQVTQLSTQDFRDPQKLQAYQEGLKNVERNINQLARAHYQKEAGEIMSRSPSFHKLEASEKLPITTEMADIQLQIKKIQGYLAYRFGRIKMDEDDLFVLLKYPDILQGMHELAYQQKRMDELLGEYNIDPQLLAPVRGFNLDRVQRLGLGVAGASIGYYALGGAAMMFAGPAGVAALAVGGFALGYASKELSIVAEHLYQNWEDIDLAFQKGQWGKLFTEIVAVYPESQPYLEFVDAIYNAKDIVQMAEKAHAFIHSHDSRLLKKLVPDLDVYADIAKHLQDFWNKGDFNGLISYIEDNERPKVRHMLRQFQRQYAPYLEVAKTMKQYLYDKSPADLKKALAYLKGEHDPEVRTLTKDWLPILEILADAERIVADKEQREIYLERLSHHVIELKMQQNNPYFGHLIKNFLHQYGNEFEEIMSLEHQLRKLLAQDPIDFTAVLQRLIEVDSAEMPGFVRNLQPPLKVLQELNDLINNPKNHIQKIDRLIDSLEKLDKENAYYGHLVKKCLGENGEYLKALQSVFHAYTALKQMAKELENAKGDIHQIFKILSAHESEIEQIQQQAKLLIQEARALIEQYDSAKTYLQPIIDTILPMTDLGIATYRIAALMSPERNMDGAQKKILDDNIDLMIQSLEQEFSKTPNHPAARLAKKGPDVAKLLILIAKNEQAHKQNDKIGQDLAYAYFHDEYDKFTEPENIEALAKDIEDLSRVIKSYQKNVHAVQSDPRQSIAAAMAGPILKEFKVSERLDFAQSMMKQSASLLRDVNILNDKKSGFFRKVGATFRILGKGMRLGLTILNAKRKGVLGKDNILKHAFIPKVLKRKLFNKKGPLGAIMRLCAGVSKKDVEVSLQTPKLPVTPTPPTHPTTELSDAEVEVIQLDTERHGDVAQKALKSRANTYESVDLPQKRPSDALEKDSSDVGPSKRPTIDP